MIKDSLGNDIGYFPVYLTAGETSSVYELRAYPERVNSYFTSRHNDFVEAFARIKDTGSFVAIKNAPIDLSSYFGSFAEIEIKFTASGIVTGVEREFLFIGEIRSGAANWNV